MLSSLAAPSCCARSSLLSCAAVGAPQRTDYLSPDEPVAAVIRPQAKQGGVQLRTSAARLTVIGGGTLGIVLGCLLGTPPLPFASPAALSACDCDCNDCDNCDDFVVTREHVTALSSSSAAAAPPNEEPAGWLATRPASVLGLVPPVVVVASPPLLITWAVVF